MTIDLFFQLGVNVFEEVIEKKCHLRVNWLQFIHQQWQFWLLYLRVRATSCLALMSDITINTQNTSQTWTYWQQQVSYRSYIDMLTNTTIEGEIQLFHFAKYRCFTSQSTDFLLRKVQIFHFAKYRFCSSFLFVSQSTISLTKGVFMA